VKSEYSNWRVDSFYAPSFRENANRELNRLAALKSNWDGYGASEIDPSAIGRARAFVQSLPANLAPSPLVVPLPDGGLQFEWHKGSKILELEVEGDNIHYLKWHPDAQIKEEATFPIVEIEKAVSLIRWFTGTVANV